MKILVAVASRHGSTREIAAAIVEELRAANFAVDLQEAGAVSAIAFLLVHGILTDTISDGNHSAGTHIARAIGIVAGGTG